MALLTHSETLAFNGFLSSIDFGDSLEWSGINPDTIPRTPAQGKEALAKATKDLMSLEPNLHASDADAQQQHRPSPVELNAHWPSFHGDQAPQHDYTYGFGVQPAPSSRPPHRAPPAPAPRRSPSQDIFSGPRSRSPRSRGPSSASSSSLPADQGPPASAPAVLNRSASSSKRGLPDGDWQGSSSAKRRRPSVVAGQQQQQTQRTPRSPAPAAPLPRSTRASSVSSSTTTATGAGEGGAKPALLSPSQKRANHIQSEQKRRANIRKGYEALCEAVPALRDAIRAEEETARVGDDKPKRKKKSKAEEEKQDGRAGPKSENVVLQKTIDHVQALLAERAALSLRLRQARGTLPHGHPALAYSPHHLDDKGALLWDREWTGGSGWGDVEDDAGDDE